MNIIIGESNLHVDIPALTIKQKGYAISFKKGPESYKVYMYLELWSTRSHIVSRAVCPH